MVKTAFDRRLRLFLDPSITAAMNAMHLWPVCLALFLSSAGSAAPIQRNYTVVDFERIRVIGPFIVDLETGKAPSAKASGDAVAVERVSVSVQGRILVIKANSSAWGGWPGKANQPARIRVTVPRLRGASLEGAGMLSINKMRAPRIDLGLSGAGTLNVIGLDTDRLDMTVMGSGSAKLAGVARIGNFVSEGSATIAAVPLKVTDLAIDWRGSGNADATAVRTAKVQASGAGNVTVAGSPACTVVEAGAGSVMCGGVAGSQSE